MVGCSISIAAPIKAVSARCGTGGGASGSAAWEQGRGLGETLPGAAWAVGAIGGRRRPVAAGDERRRKSRMRSRAEDFGRRPGSGLSNRLVRGCRVRLSKNSASTRRSSGLRSIRSGGSTAASSSTDAAAGAVLWSDWLDGGGGGRRFLRSRSIGLGLGPRLRSGLRPGRAQERLAWISEPSSGEARARGSAALRCTWDT